MYKWEECSVQKKGMYKSEKEALKKNLESMPNKKYINPEEKLKLVSTNSYT